MSDDLPELVELSNGTETLTFDGGNTANPDDDVLLIGEDGVEGWFETPDDKTVMSERGQGDGAHDVWASDILYSARVLTLHFIVSAHDRQGVVRLLNKVRRVCAHSKVRFRLRDAGYDCYTTGRATVKASAKYANDGWLDDCTITVTCERPEILSMDECTCQLSAMHVSGGNVGLRYGPGYWTEWQGARNASPSLMHTESNIGLRGLAYPLNYGLKLDGVGSNVGLLYNNGTSRAYPVFVVHGPMDGVRLDFPGTQQSIVCDQTVRDVPLVLDCRSRTAQLGGQDVSRQLEQRGFPTIPAGGSLRVTLSNLGTGFVDCSVRDTYM